MSERTNFTAWSAGAVVLFVAGCGAGSGTTVNPSPFAIAAARTSPTHVPYQMLYVFQGAPKDAGEPYSDLIDVDGTLYGTTSIGGPYNSGSVFAITTAGQEMVLHFFSKARSGDGAQPVAGLRNVHGTLYGTTVSGGSYACGPSKTQGCGTVYAITKSGQETVLHRFGLTSRDGSGPYAGVIDVNGLLYGTTSEGGAKGLGTVFAINPSGAETMRYSFGRARRDGANPYAGLIDVRGTLYGTTLNGGTYGAGTVYSISTAGEEHVLHSFGERGDGAFPYDRLLDVNGTLYGTTSAGGRGQVGTVFAISRSGKETVIHDFNDTRNGADPVAGLIDVKGVLYGTTVLGGLTNFGTVYAMTTSGTRTVLYRFRGGYGEGGNGDGSNPYATLLNVRGSLYGTTFFGGMSREAAPDGTTHDSDSFCCGTVFRITP